MRLIPHTEDAAQKVSHRALLAAGWHPARIAEAVEKKSKRGNDMIELTIHIPDADDHERTLRDWLTDNALGTRRCAQGLLACEECHDFVGLVVAQRRTGSMKIAAVHCFNCQTTIPVRRGVVMLGPPLWFRLRWRLSQLIAPCVTTDAGRRQIFFGHDRGPQ